MHVSIPQCPPPPPPGIHPVLDILANVCNWLPQGQISPLRNLHSSPVMQLLYPTIVTKNI